MATFKTRARALDMLGRQQIAGVPTAISELFKNAHDAYADHVEVDYYRTDGLFVLRDDGMGMTHEEFSQRWLTLGTESKFSKTKADGTAPFDNKATRQMLGEKGVGRLAIAIIGPQVLVLSRSRRDEVRGNTVAAFIHWGLFECAGVDLDQIEIPIKVFQGGKLPSRNDLQEMVACYRANIEKLSSILSAADKDRISADLDLFDFDPTEVDGYQPHLSLQGDGHGTHFIIMPASEMLNADLDEESKEVSSNLVRMLGGFTNTMTPEHAPPVIATAFRYYKTDDVYEDIIDSGSFFTPTEFQNADHAFIGEFDAYGQFCGTVRVYDKEYNNHIISWKNARGFPTKCGPFSIHVANVQGSVRDSTLPIQEWAALTSKMNRFGGLYIYRDGIRILPYGNTDYDWLDIERNRTKSAAYYFFSFRRMFGVVSITHSINGNLHEKAGREGFRENEAYREFKSILQNFFVQLAADFFRKDGEGTIFHETKLRLSREAELRQKREESVRFKLGSLKKNLVSFFEKKIDGLPAREVGSLLEELQGLLARASVLPSSQAAELFLNLEGEYTSKLASIEESYRIIRPKGVALSTPLQRGWDEYASAFNELQQTVFVPARARLEQVVGQEAAQARLELGRRLRIERSLAELSQKAKRQASQEKKATDETESRIQQEIITITRESSAKIRRTLEEVSVEFARTDVANMEDATVVETRERLENTLIAVRDKECNKLQTIRSQLEALDLSGQGGLLDQLEAVEQRTVALEERADLDLQLTQLGMAIGVINHEFDSSIRSVRHNLKRLKGWADINPNLEELYQNIRNSFEHLDGYLTLFTPLHRRLYRKEIVMRGSDIHKFLHDLFGERLRRHDVRLEATRKFEHVELIGYPSTFYPVFVNLVDNAIFWVKDQSLRVITLDFVDGSLVVKDTGPGIQQRDRESIFELGFSRKPEGRGLGLHITREVLMRSGKSIRVGDSSHGAEFIISDSIGAVEAE